MVDWFVWFVSLQGRFGLPVHVSLALFGLFWDSAVTAVLGASSGNYGLLWFRSRRVGEGWSP